MFASVMLLYLPCHVVWQAVDVVHQCKGAAEGDVSLLVGVGGSVIRRTVNSQIKVSCKDKKTVMQSLNTHVFDPTHYNDAPKSD